MSTTLLASDIFYMKNENFTLPTHPYIRRKAFRRRSDLRFQARRQRSCRGAVFLRCYDVRIDAHFALTMGAQGHSEELRGVANGTGRITCGRTVTQCFSSCASSLPRRAASWPFPPSLRFRNAFSAPCDGAMAVISLAKTPLNHGSQRRAGTQKSVVQQDGIPDFFQDFFGIEGGIKNAEALIVADNMA